MGIVKSSLCTQPTGYPKAERELLETPVAMVGVRPMRGGSQAKLLFADDAEYYIVKFSNNPQHRRILINEWVATHLAKSIGLTVPTCKIIHVDHELVTSDPTFTFELPRGERQRCQSGPQFGSVLIREAIEWLSSEQLLQVSNLCEFAGILCLDKWLYNQDGRQAVFTLQEQGGYHAVFIDQGFCFGAAEWVFRDEPLRGVYHNRVVYSSVQGLSDFEPWLSRIELLDDDVLHRIAHSIPEAWFADDQAQLMQLLDKLLLRKERLRTLIYECGRAEGVFPKWLEYDRREHQRLRLLMYES